MPDCKNCSAPLPPDTLVCTYCGTRNDIDLRGVHEYTTAMPTSDRICPRCEKPLRTIDLKIEGTFLIEQCEGCVGLFFDPGELEALLEKSVAHTYQVDHKLINQINTQKRRDEFGVTYIKCPVCQKLMNRVGFGHRSGVVVDRCRDHGVWLDGGELRHLMEWKKAGGELLHQQAQERKKAEEQRLKQRRERDKQYRAARDSGYGVESNPGGFFASSATRRRQHANDDLLGLLGNIADFFS